MHPTNTAQFATNYGLFKAAPKRRSVRNGFPELPVDVLNLVLTSSAVVYEILSQFQLAVVQFEHLVS